MMKNNTLYQTLLVALVSSAALLNSGCVPSSTIIPPVVSFPSTKPATPAPPPPPVAKPVPQKRPSATRPAPVAKQPTASVQHANALMKQGKKHEAADMYYRAAFNYPSPQRERLVLQAAEITASTGDNKRTENYLSRLNYGSLQGENRDRLQYIKALVAIQGNNPNQALQLLPKDFNKLTPAMRKKVQFIHQRALAMGGRAPQVVAQAVLPPETKRIAVLLPGSGALGAVSSDIYKGVQDANQRFGNKTRVKFYDVAKGGGAVEQYKKAVSDGADIVIGPLDKGSIAKLLAQPQILNKPLLGLNYLSNTQRIPGTLYQFGLSPEDEARQIAEFAIARGQTQAVMLVPNSSWGQRLATSFRQTYEARGGRILHAEPYAGKPTGYLQNVNNALAGSQGQAQMAFLAASPTQARFMKPLLQARAKSLPVYATSHIYSGKGTQGKNVDLDGIIYTEIPLVLNQSAANTLETTKYPRLYAFGMDAFLIAKNLNQLTRSQGTPLNGQTGEIRLTGQRKIARKLQFATFVNGQPRPLGN